MKEIYLIDGYNVINYWQEFKDIREKDLEHARDLLAHQLSEFVAFHGCDGTLVYDAMDVPGGEETEWIGPCGWSIRPNTKRRTAGLSAPPTRWPGVGTAAFSS